MYKYFTMTNIGKSNLDEGKKKKHDQLFPH